MPLQQLAGQISVIRSRACSTPVLVTPSYLSLQAPFFVALSTELALCDHRLIRFDWLREVPGAFSFGRDFLADRKATRINRTLASSLQSIGTKASIQITAAIGRPSSASSSLASSSEDLVIGICADHHERPTWTTPIRLVVALPDRDRLESCQAA